MVTNIPSMALFSSHDKTRPNKTALYNNTLLFLMSINECIFGYHQNEAEKCLHISAYIHTYKIMFEFKLWPILNERGISNWSHSVSFIAALLHFTCNNHYKQNIPKNFHKNLPIPIIIIVVFYSSLNTLHLALLWWWWWLCACFSSLYESH